MFSKFSEDLKSIREILGVSQEELAKMIDVEQVTISRTESELTNPSSKLVDVVYELAFEKGIRLNKIKEMLISEEIPSSHKLLFHGAKSEIIGKLDWRVGRKNNDFGQGFYTGETYEQAISFVAGYPKSSVYLLDFNPGGLKYRKYDVNQDWMLTIAYNRGSLDEYNQYEMIQRLVKESRDCDYIIAPIADNRMFQIINSFISGEITNVQCEHCLAATNLGYQYVFISDQAIKNIKIVDCFYLCRSEKDYYQSVRSADIKIGDDKVKMARIQYRGKGRYIDEILKG